MVMQRVRAYVLVKAYPQPSTTYEETVCCAGITDEGRFVRMYPIRYRHLPPEARFNRFDLLEFEAERPKGDNRPESLHIKESSISIVRSNTTLTSRQKAELWSPMVARSLKTLRDENKSSEVSLGIVKPDAGSVKFRWEESAKSSETDAAISKALLHQTSLIEQPLKPLTPPEYAFYYKYKSDGTESNGQIHDWEVQAAFLAYKKKYGGDALSRMREMYETTIPASSLHLVLGTMKAHPRQFIIIGLLRTSEDLQQIAAQPRLI